MDLQETLRLHLLWLQGVKEGIQANLSGADLSGANLRRVNLRRANLSGANLRRVNLYRADLSGANLRKINLLGANLHRADLSGADLHRANLHRADLSGAWLSSFQIVPEEGPFIGYKKVLTRGRPTILKLEIPADAKRTSTLVGRKCRASYVKVLEGSAVSIWDYKVRYEHGEYVYPDSYDDDIRVECSHGIHFFLTRKEAEDF